MNATVAVIGLGAMGAALARTQLAAGYQTIVWNRTSAKTKALIDEGAIAADSGAAAVSAADIILVCVDTSASAETALEGVWNKDGLTGRVVAQLGTTTPEEARAFAAKVTNAGGKALDGAIMSYPDGVGPESQTPLMVGGDPEGFKMAGPYLRQISGNLIDLGSNVAAAAALDLGLLTTGVALYAGVAHAAHLCEAEGADVNLLAQLFFHGQTGRERLEIITKDAFALNSLHDGGSLAVWADVVNHLKEQARTAGINSDLPDFLGALYRRAVDQGHGDEDVAALVKALRK